MKMKLFKLALISLFFFNLFPQTAIGGCGGAGAGSGSDNNPPLGSNDLPSDMNYPSGQSPRELYITRYESILINSPDNKDAIKRLGIVYHHQGALEVSGMPEKAIEYLERLLETSPEDDEARAFLGSSKTMIARDSWNPITKLSLVNEGIDLIDEAIENSPKNILIRLVRANNSLNLPGFLGRESLAKSDYLYIEKISDDPEAEFGLPSEYGENDRKDVMANVYYKIGRIYKLEDNDQMATKYFKKSIAAWPNSRWARGAAIQLDKI